jgi:ParB/RepB/Spo0J family partition protein
VTDQTTVPDVSRDTSLDLIDPDPDQPRRHFDPAKLTELAQSIAANGLASPILLRPGQGGRLLLVHGERRWRAARQLGWTTIPAIVRDVDPADVPWVQLAENIQRADLSPIEEATAYRERLAAGITQEQLAERVGKTRTYITQKLRLLGLPDPLQHYLDVGAISEGHARQLLRIKALYQVPTPTGGGEISKAAVTVGEAVDCRGLDFAALAELVVPELVFPLLRDARPEDNPPLWVGILWAEGGPDAERHQAIVTEGARRFFQHLAVDGPATPQWVVAAFWWATATVDYELTVATLAGALDAWMDRLAAAVVHLELMGSADAKRPASDTTAGMDWWGYRADLRHAGLLACHDRLVAPMLDRIDKLMGEGSLPLASCYQRWGFQHDSYQKQLEREGGL